MISDFDTVVLFSCIKDAEVPRTMHSKERAIAICHMMVLFLTTPRTQAVHRILQQRGASKHIQCGDDVIHESICLRDTNRPFLELWEKH